MGAEQTTTLQIVCDNPACPGNQLDPADRTGWIFVNRELYGSPVPEQAVYCCLDCESGHATTVVFDEPLAAAEAVTSNGEGA